MDKRTLKAVYGCDTCRKSIVTLDEEAGAKQPWLFCRATPGCPGTMRPSYMGFDQTLVPTWEWFKPRFAFFRSAATRRWIRIGGLELRPIRAGRSAR